MTDIRDVVADVIGGKLRDYDIWPFQHVLDATADAALAVARPLIEAEARRKLVAEVLNSVPLGQADLFLALHDQLTPFLPPAQETQS